MVDLERRVAMLEKKLKALDNKVGAAEIQAAQKEAARARWGKPGTNVLTRRSRKS
jgi:outer membrane murein-binding lipoprotein Lpp